MNDLKKNSFLGCTTYTIKFLVSRGMIKPFPHKEEIKSMYDDKKDAVKTMYKDRKILVRQKFRRPRRKFRALYKRFLKSDNSRNSKSPGRNK